MIVTPLGSKPGTTGLRTNIGPPPTHCIPPSMRATQYAHIRSNCSSVPSNEPPPPLCGGTTSR
jgi:hypothetical protein